MKKILLFISLFIFFACEKQINEHCLKADFSIKSVFQAECSEWGYYDNGVFHHVLSPFVLDSVTNLKDTTFTSLTGEVIVIKDDTTYVQFGTELFKICHRIDFGTAEIRYLVKNKTKFTIGYYEFKTEIYCSDGTVYENIFHGAGVPKWELIEEIAYFETHGRKIIDIIITDYYLDHKY
jgi:hypothetical protein